MRGHQEARRQCHAHANFFSCFVGPGDLYDLKVRRERRSSAVNLKKVVWHHGTIWITGLDQRIQSIAFIEGLKYRILIYKIVT